ncbi:MAG: BolA family protein [Bryobacteraceae bacterium]|nr:BolA family protein [Bryobacteraceae bacterium]
MTRGVPPLYALYMDTVGRIQKRLAAALSPDHLEVIDESGQHAGHAGAIPGKTTHIRVRVVAGAFRGKNRIDRHRIVNDIMKDEIAAGLHALAIEAKAPGE